MSNIIGKIMSRLFTTGNNTHATYVEYSLCHRAGEPVGEGCAGFVDVSDGRWVGVPVRPNHANVGVVTGICVGPRGRRVISLGGVRPIPSYNIIRQLGRMLGFCDVTREFCLNGCCMDIDTDSPTWVRFSLAPDCTFSRCRPVMAQLGSGIVVIAGGIDADTYESIPGCEYFDPCKCEFVKGPSMSYVGNVFVRALVVDDFGAVVAFEV